LHSRIDGPAAYDVLYNFEQRWTKAAKRHGLKKLKRWNDDALLQLDRLPEIIGISELNAFNENDPETWHVQVDEAC
jgi:phospholipase D1/2